MKKNKLQQGNIMLITVLFVCMVGASVILTSTKSTVSTTSNTKNLLQSKQSFATAESGIEDVLYRIRNNIAYSNQEVLNIGDSSTTTDITSGASDKTISALGIFNGKNRGLNVNVVTGTGTSFSYGMQTGQGGISFGSNSGVVGNIYTNGPITGASNAYITGTAVAASGGSATADQSYGNGSASSVDTTFRNASGTQDATQSFVISATNPLSKARIYIKKFGSPTNATVTIRTNNSGNPSSTVVATGTLTASLITTSYSWVDVTFSTSPALTAGTTYWLTVDNSSTSASAYYVWGGGNAGYSSGLGKIGTVGGTWYSSPSQIASGTDLFFEIYTGGASGSISNVIVGTGSTGDAWANTVTGSTVRGTLYCQTGSSNNKSCNTTRADPTQQDFPISDATINDWKDTAAAGSITTGNVTISTNQSMGPKKIVGNLTVDNSKTLTLTGVVWVTGNITVSNNGIIKLDSSYGSNGGMIIADGTITISNNGDMRGSGTTGSFMMAISTSSSGSAISIDNNAGSVVLYAPNGTLSLSNNAGAKQATAYRISLSNNATVTYDSGLANSVFSSGPSGGWNISKWKDLDF